ncbi:MAG: aminoglycoside phosphotransferase family protein [Nanoarchaeota archaeon]|nr:aminoglycoside phosphotransferase family protein [Nanoarchaeota archaeon]
MVKMLKFETEMIEKIFKNNNLGSIHFFKKIEIGFTNQVYIINDKYVLKININEENSNDFRREYELYNFFNGTINVPKVIVYDNFKKVIEYDYMVYHKIEGENLYAIWDTYSIKDRKEIVKQICSLLRIINQTSLIQIKHIFPIQNICWKDIFLMKILKVIVEVEEKNILQKEIIDEIKSMVNTNINLLKEENMKLTYFDLHFDNILVKEKMVVGIIDFERVDICSIDLTLDVIRRMKEYPLKYPNQKWKAKIRREDYLDLLDWFNEFYPELFDFKKLEIRLDLYSLEHDLDTLIAHPNSEETKEMIFNVLSKYKNVNTN